MKNQNKKKIEACNEVAKALNELEKTTKNQEAKHLLNSLKCFVENVGNEESRDDGDAVSIDAFKGLDLSLEVMVERLRDEDDFDFIEN